MCHYIQFFHSTCFHRAAYEICTDRCSGRQPCKVSCHNREGVALARGTTPTPCVYCAGTKRGSVFRKGDFISIREVQVDEDLGVLEKWYVDERVSNWKGVKGTKAKFSFDKERNDHRRGEDDGVDVGPLDDWVDHSKAGLRSLFKW